MKHISFFRSARSLKTGRLLFLKILVLLLGLLPMQSFAHPSPNTLVFLDVSPDRVAMEVQMPLSELELAFGQNISKDPETLLERFVPQLKEYLLAHIHAYAKKDRPWTVNVASVKMDKGKYVDSNIPYWEVNAEVTLTPQSGDNTRTFFLDYDAIMHQVINHVALVSIRNDWEGGKVHQDATEAVVIGWNLKDNLIPPLDVNLDRGSKWKGFGSMVSLGMQHIKEGTDHLLFLLVLLLPAMLLVRSNRWASYGGMKYSVQRIIKIVTSFTIGHSVTLILATFGWVRLPQQPVEILIAVSIFVSAVHAIRPFAGKEMYVAAGFGLIHGLAFATVLSELNLGASTLALSIFGFNLGIELMQLFVVLMALPLLIILSKQNTYSILRIGGAFFAAIAAVAWIVQRITNEANFISSYVERIAANGVWLIVALAFVAVFSLIIYRNEKPVLQKTS